MSISRSNRRAAPRTWVLLALLLLVPTACSDPTSPDPEPMDEGVWQPLGQGLTGSASTFLEWDGGLVVGGVFRTAGDQPARNVAFWDGTLWQTLGTGLEGPVQSLTVHRGDLVAAGAFGLDVSRVFRWTGGGWQPMGLLQDGGIMTLAVHDGVLYAQGFEVSRWTGSGWEPVQAEVDGEVHDAEPPMAVHASHLVVAVGSEHLARWDGQTWEWIERPQGLFALVAGDGQLFAHASGVEGTPYLRWTGAGWEGLPSIPLRRSWTVHAGHLVVGVHGGFGEHYLLRWDGSEWSPVPGGMDDWVNGLGSFGSTLLAGGDFTVIDGSPFRGVAGIVPAWAMGQGGS